MHLQLIMYPSLIFSNSITHGNVSLSIQKGISEKISLKPQNNYLNSFHFTVNCLVPEYNQACTTHNPIENY